MDIGVIAENKEKYISFNVNINVKLAGVRNKDGEEIPKINQLRFIVSCRFMASSLDKQASNLCETREIYCDKYKELVYNSNKYMAIMECKRCKTKKGQISR